MKVQLFGFSKQMLLMASSDKVAYYSLDMMLA